MEKKNQLAVTRGEGKGGSSGGGGRQEEKGNKGHQGTGMKDPWADNDAD